MVLAGALDAAADAGALPPVEAGLGAILEVGMGERRRGGDGGG